MARADPPKPTGEKAQRGESGEDLREILYRLDALEREAELAPVQAQAHAVPRGAGRRTVVAKDWTDGNRPRAMCSAATGQYTDLLRATEKTLADQARIQGWDLVVDYEPEITLPPLWLKFAMVESLLEDYELVAWIDADAIFMNPTTPLEAALGSNADVYLTEPTDSPGRPTAADSGLVVFRSSPGARQLLDKMLREPMGDPDVALTALLQEKDAPWRVAWLDRAWNSILTGAQAPNPNVLHFAAAPLEHRQRGLLAAAADVMASNISCDPLDDVPRREDLPRLLNRLGLLGTAVEVGVRNGAFSAWVLHRWHGYRLISIDPWAFQPTDEYVDIANVEQDRHDELLEQTRHRLQPFGARSEIWRRTSEEAAALIADSSLDFAYLDARHDQASVEDDLALWYPKLRPGGLLAGHDYLDGNLPEGRFGVKTAVDRFFKEQDQPVYTTVRDAPWLSWFASR